MDETETMRRQMVDQINRNPKTREELERDFGKVWAIQELTQDFEVKGFLAPFAIVKRKQDGKMGSLLFQHHPRFYFSWEEYRP
jgi:hypothetical protein